MISRFLISLALCSATAAGLGVSLLVSQATGPDGGRQEEKSITGVGSGVRGTQAKEAEKRGVDQITVPLETPTAAGPERTAASQPNHASSPRANRKGIRGTEESTVEIVAANDNAVQLIRGIKGIDTVMLQNLETVLRMQSPPPPPQGGAVRAAAALLTLPNDATPGPETETDDRKELTEFELEGS